MLIGIETPIPLEYDHVYYSAESAYREFRDLRCPACQGTGRVMLCDGNLYRCPKCNGGGKIRGICSETFWHIAKWKLVSLSASPRVKMDIVWQAVFERIDGVGQKRIIDLSDSAFCTAPSIFYTQREAEERCIQLKGTKSR